MRFARIILSLAFLGFLISCGVKQDEPSPPPPDIPELINTGWQLYDEGNYSEALEIFDSVISLNDTIPYAYLGLAWSQAQVGELSSALNNYSLTKVLLKQEFAKPIFGQEAIPLKDTSLWHQFIDTVEFLDTCLEVNISQRPVIAIVKIKKGIEDLYNNIIHFTDSSVVVVYKALLSRNPDSLPDDTFYIDYYVYEEPSGDVDSLAKWAYLGEAFTFNANGDYMYSMMSGRVACELGFLPFNHGKNPVDKISKLYGVMALSAFKKGYYLKACEFLEMADTTWTHPTPSFDPDNFLEILRKLNEVLNQ